jgi:hypothetical protein
MKKFIIKGIVIDLIILAGIVSVAVFVNLYAGLAILSVFVVLESIGVYRLVRSIIRNKPETYIG